MDIYYLLLYFFVYGFLGWCSEVGFAAVKQHMFVNRGFLNGPICPIYGVGVTVVVTFLMPLKGNLLLLYAASTFLVTVLEGVTGWAMFRIFHHKWWDYSDIPFNIGGYVCLPFSILWGVVCVLIVDFIHPLIHQMLTWLPYTPGVVLVALLLVALIADSYVTAAAIFKFNRHLEHMEKIAAELREISNQIGEDIYEGTMHAVEKREKMPGAREVSAELREKISGAREVSAELREKISGAREASVELREKISGAREASAELREKMPGTREVSAELRERITELRSRYAALAAHRHLVFERLIKAFPKMESSSHREQLNVFRRRMNERLKRNMR